MTEGTSQGLFIVVAIVIFGIFVSLSYTLFGSQGLSNDLKGLFLHATEDATDSLNKNGNLSLKNMITIDDFKLKATNLEAQNMVKTSDSITFSSKKGMDLVGIYIPSSIFESGSTYTFEYDIKLIEGTYNRIGGHLNLPTRDSISIDGVNIPNSTYRDGVAVNPVLGESINVKTEFRLSLDDITASNFLFIQPNRVTSYIDNPNAYNTDYRVEISNPKLVKIK